MQLGIILFAFYNTLRVSHRKQFLREYISRCRILTPYILFHLFTPCAALFPCKSYHKIVSKSILARKRRWSTIRRFSAARSISIYASHTGDDLLQGYCLHHQPYDFNPRLPYGRQLHTRLLRCIWDYFNPRLPYGRRPSSAAVLL